MFVLDEAGRTLVDPSFPNLGGRDFKGIRDASGNRPIDEILRKLRDSDTATAQYLQPKPGTGMMARKYLSARRAHWQGQTFIVGGEYFLPIPIWLGG